MENKTDNYASKSRSNENPFGFGPCLNWLQFDHYILLAVILWMIGCNQVWVLLDTRPPSWDQGLHLHLAFKYWAALTSGQERWWLDLLNVEPYYPPFYHLSLLPGFVVFGFSTDNAVLVNSFYLAVITLSTYGIGKILYDRRTGLFAAILISFYPFLALVSRQCLIDTMLIAVVSLCYYLFLRTHNFEDRFYSILFSLSFAVGLMVKWTFFFYLLPAVFIGLFDYGEDSLTRGLRRFCFYLGMIAALMALPFLMFVLGDGKWIILLLEFCLVLGLVRLAPTAGISPKKIINLITLTCISLLVCFPWYAHNALGMAQSAVKYNAAGAGEGDPTSGIERWTHYMQLLQLELGLPLFLQFIVGLIAFLSRRKNFNIPIFLWIAVPYLIFSLITNKDPRYLMGIFPALAIVTALPIVNLKNAVYRRGAIGIMVGVSLFGYLYSGFFPGDLKIPGLGFPVYGFKDLPVKENWQIDSILDDMVADSAPLPGQTITARTLTNHAWFHRGAFRDSAEIRGLPVIVKSVKRNQGEMTDYFITKDRSRENESGVRQINPKRDRLFDDPSLTETFSLFRSYPLPNGMQGLVLKRDVSPAIDIVGAGDLGQVGTRFIAALGQYPIYGVKNMKNARVSIIPMDNAEDLYLGRYKKITLTADSAVSNKIHFDDFELTFHDVQINLYELFLHGKLIFFKIGRLFPRATVQFEPLEQLAIKEMKGKGSARLEGEDNRLRLKAHYRLPPPLRIIEGRATVKLIFDPKKSARPVVETLKVGPISLPEIFYRRILDEQIVFSPTPGWPLHTDIRSIRIFKRRLEINQSSLN